MLQTPILLTAVRATGLGAVPKTQARVDRRRADRRCAPCRGVVLSCNDDGNPLELIGADGPTIVEGPFATNLLFASMLAGATARPVIAAGTSATGTSIGAALLAAGVGATVRTVGSDSAAIVPPTDAEWKAYAARWRAAASI